MKSVMVSMIFLISFMGFHAMRAVIEKPISSSVPSLCALAARVVVEKSKTDQKYANTLSEKIPDWELKTQEVIKNITGVPQRLQRLIWSSFSPETSYSNPFIILKNNNAVLMSPSMKKIPLPVKPGESLGSLCWSFHCDKFSVLVNSLGKGVHATAIGFDAHKETQIFEVQNTRQVIWGFSGNKVLIQSGAGQHFIINFISGSTCTLPPCSAITNYFWSYDETFLASIDEADVKGSYTDPGCCRVLDTATGKVVRTIKPLFMFPKAAGWSRDGSCLVIAGSKNYMPLAIEIAVYDMRKSSTEPVWQSSLLTDEYVDEVSWSPDNSFILLSSSTAFEFSAGFKIRIFDSRTGEIVKHLRKLYVHAVWNENRTLQLIKKEEKELKQLTLGVTKHIDEACKKLTALECLMLMNYTKASSITSRIPACVIKLWEKRL